MKIRIKAKSINFKIGDKVKMRPDIKSFEVHPAFNLRLLREIEIPYVRRVVGIDIKYPHHNTIFNNKSDFENCIKTDYNGATWTLPRHCWIKVE